MAGHALGSDGDGFIVDPAPKRSLEQAQPKPPMPATEAEPRAKPAAVAEPAIPVKPPMTAGGAGERSFAPPGAQLPRPPGLMPPGATKAAVEAPLEPEAAPRGSRPAPRRQNPELYDQAVARAQKSLADERPGDDLLPPHPVVSANPDFNVVMCFAGCGSERDRVVFFKKRFTSGLTPAPSTAGPAVIKVADGPAPPRPQQVASADTEPACVAGCYGNDPAARPARNGAADGTVSGRIPGGTWLTTQAKADPFAGKVAPDATPKRVSPAKPKRSSSEWFTKRF